SPVSATLTENKGRGRPVQAPNFCNSSLPTLARPFASLHRYLATSLHRIQGSAHAGIPATPIPSMLYFITPVHPGGGVPSQWYSHPWLPHSGSRVTDHGTPATGHGLTGPDVPLRRNPQSARIADVRAWCPPGNISATSVSKIPRADIGFGIRRLPNPIARRSQNSGQGSHSQEGLGPA